MIEIVTRETAHTAQTLSSLLIKDSTICKVTPRISGMNPFDVMTYCNADKAM
ncbi:hypothetical protein SK128_013909, partial [Halocaridina rubra]